MTAKQRQEGISGEWACITAPRQRRAIWIRQRVQTRGSPRNFGRAGITPTEKGRCGGNHEIEKRHTGRSSAHGGGGHNFYMLHGGTDFDSWNNDEMAASYDDGAAIGQAGDLRPVYYQMKRQNQLTGEISWKFSRTEMMP